LEVIQKGRFCLDSIATSIEPNEVVPEQGDILRPLPEWGDMKGDYVEAIEKVLPKSAGLHLSR